MIDVLTALLILIVAAVLLSGIRVVREWERVPVLRLGRFIGVKGPGLIYVIPGIDKVPKKISMRVHTVPFSAEQTLTKDNVPVNVDAVMYARPVDPEKCILNVEDYELASMWAAQTTLREVIGQVDLNELLTEREAIAARLREIIDEKTEHWGVKVDSVEIRDVVIPKELQDAMSRMAQAERERIARVTLAQAEYEAANRFLEAARIYADNPRALEIRWMNILYELGQTGKGSIIFIPVQMPSVAFPAVGMLGVEKLPMEGEEGEKKEEGKKD